jgi:hypothetical protein
MDQTDCIRLCELLILIGGHGCKAGNECGREAENIAA